MAIFEKMLEPIPGENPSGVNLRHDPLYRTIQEARREDDELGQGVWEHERKTADYSLVIKIATTALTTRTKDLQLGAWFAHANLRKEGFEGLRQGIVLCRGLIETFWDTLYPNLEDDDLEMRASPLEWMASCEMDIAVRNSPLTKDGFGWYLYMESRVPAPGKLAPEVFNKSFIQTPKAFYAELEGDLDGSLLELEILNEVCQGKFGASAAPPFGKLREGLEDVRRVAHSLLQKKRETEPDPAVKPEPLVTLAANPECEVVKTVVSAPRAIPTHSVSVPSSNETPERQHLITSIAAAAATLRQEEPLNAAGYLVMRGLRWGELRNAATLADSAMLEAPPTEIRQQIKRLALQESWLELLELAEGVMALPCSRAWLDLQRFAIEACNALGGGYAGIAAAIRSELRALLQDVPELANCTLTDDTPTANLETRRWLRQLLSEPASRNGHAQLEAEPSPEEQNPVRWQKRFLDSHVLAQEALRIGNPEKALEIMQDEISRQRSPRGRFQRRLQFVELCIAAGKDLIAQPLLEDLITAIDTHKLEEWEDKSAMAGALVTVMRASKRIQGDAKEKQKFFERICRLDPVQALNC